MLLAKSMYRYSYRDSLKYGNLLSHANRPLVMKLFKIPTDEKRSGDFTVRCGSIAVPQSLVCWNGKKGCEQHDHGLGSE